MNPVCRHMFEERLSANGGREEQALAEVIQSLVLLGLSRSDFFTRAAFYGGTALRMIHALDRFSEDLDFSLDRPRPGFTLERYLNTVRHELESFGLVVEVLDRAKRRESAIESAYIKANTLTTLMQVPLIGRSRSGMHKNQITRVKIEVDTNPPTGARFETSYLGDPVPFAVRRYDDPSLFAGKLHAVLARAWKSRVKGRDWFDMVFLLGRRVPASLGHLEARLRQTGAYTDAPSLTAERLKGMLAARIDAVDLRAAKADVIPFVRRPENLDVWSREFFLAMVDLLQVS